jgi:hypothetical protein
VRRGFGLRSVTVPQSVPYCSKFGLSCALGGASGPVVGLVVMPSTTRRGHREVLQRCRRFRGEAEMGSMSAGTELRRTTGALFVVGAVAPEAALLGHPTVR